MIRIYPTNYNKKECEALQDLVNEMETMFNTCYCPQVQGQNVDCEKCEYLYLCKAITDAFKYVGGISCEKDRYQTSSNIR